jgi:DNA repair exonuclease SbcCD ATPase subunit
MGEIIEDRIRTIETQLISLQERRKHILDQLKKERIASVRIKMYLDQYGQVKDHLVSAGNSLRRHVTGDLERLVTLALRSVYKSQQYSFIVDVTGKSRRLNVEMRVKKGDVEGDIDTTFGGGVLDVVSTILRLAMAERFGIRGPILLDEPGRMMDSTMLETFSEILRRYSNENDRQLVMVTRFPSIADRADQAFEVTQEGGRSVIA